MKTKDEILREKILLGADKLFQKYGLSKTTMEDIAREAGKGKSTLYYYFKSKEEIFDAIVQQEKGRLFNQIQEEISKVPTAVEKLRTFVTIRFLRLKDISNLYNVMIEEVRDVLNQQPGDFACPYRKQYDQKEANIVKSILQYGIVTGEFRVFSESDLDMMVFVFMSAQHGLELDLIIYDKLDELLTRLNFLHEIMLSGIKK
ncbi:TetR/AcrR family transcriptional regulator [Dyadobacter sp. CY312]|uniref:TetR/AcrR family transcriptional regulator n=1 Tax=Dyadobacter sp. CY312 TaxID=2907303 RepID=UPI001F2CCF3B|nr:TetR/AcrR family transcriptional regulator [Dyadobacter sp. CY312]MCE7043220.1 TetR/AcrR family transcriptional regulator [Dyadobacter sp. CY312]